MSRLLDRGSKLIGQGLTGGEGSRALPKMLEYGTQIVAGVTPGKGGQQVAGVPIFNTVKEALEEVGPVAGSVQFVPPMFTKAAVQEALEAGLKFVLIGAEKVPAKDGAIIYALAEKHQANVVGPSSVGMISPNHKIVLGLMAAGAIEKVYVPGPIGIISKSGSMTAEIALHLKNHGLGISWAVGIGGDIIASTDFADFLLDLEDDPGTGASVIFGELGGTYEEKVAELVKNGQIKKPVVALIAGDFTLQLPKEVQFGHAGAMIEGNRGLPDHKRQVLKEAGVKVAEKFDDIARLVKESLDG